MYDFQNNKYIKIHYVHILLLFYNLLFLLTLNRIIFKIKKNKLK